MTPNRVNRIVKRLSKMMAELEKAAREAAAFEDEMNEAAEHARSRARMWHEEKERAERVRHNLEKLVE